MNRRVFLQSLAASLAVNTVLGAEEAVPPP